MRGCGCEDSIESLVAANTHCVDDWLSTIAIISIMAIGCVLLILSYVVMGSVYEV